MMIWWIVLLAVAVIAVCIWTIRRQAAAREAASAERMKAFMEQARGIAPAKPAAGSVSASSSAPALAVVPTTQRSAPARPVDASGFAARASLLSVEQAAVYQTLKSALPECELLPHMRLQAFIQPAENLSGFAREAQQRRLADAVIDFLLCDKSLKPLAAVQCAVQPGKPAETAAFAAACVTAAGLRWLEIAPAALPERETLRARVLGASSKLRSL